jgi:hypothetical protein
MGIWGKWRKPKRPQEEIRAGIASEVLDLQLQIIRMMMPGALVGLRETDFLASIAMSAMLSTTPGKTPAEKEKDHKAYMDVLIRAVDIGIEDDTQEAQQKFQDLFKERWTAYLLPTAYLLGQPDTYSKLEKPLYQLLADRMELEPTLVEVIEMEHKLQIIIKDAAKRVWALTQDN